MSWSAKVSPCPAGLFAGLARQAFEDEFTEVVKVRDEEGKEREERHYHEPMHEVKEQFERALAAAQHLIPAIQPNQDGVIAGRLSGHANKGHAAGGGNNDAINISVYVPDSSA